MAAGPQAALLRVQTELREHLLGRLAAAGLPHQEPQTSPLGMVVMEAPHLEAAAVEPRLQTAPERQARAALAAMA
jgi:hypothetical protein